MKLLCTLLLVSTQVLAKNYIEENLKKMNWNGVEVIWLEDSSLPTYDISVYFQDGAMSEKPSSYGVTQLMFEQLTSGTKRYNQSDIVESLEFFGAQFGSRVTHEFSTFGVSGLVKDMVPTMKMVCHLFDDASFPKKELKSSKSRVMTGLNSLITQHGKLANRVFRYESLKGSGYESPVSGTLKSLKKINSKHLSARLNQFNKDVKKRIYIKGSSEIKKLKAIFEKDCGWSATKSDVKYSTVKSPKVGNEIIFVSVPGANQAQVRLGRIISTEEVMAGRNELKSFASNYMGGGFTSQLIQVLRVQKGLTYSAGAYHSEQNSYGRTGISTFTKNETIVEMLDTVQEVIKKNTKEVTPKNFLYSKRNLKGNYLLGLESTSDFLQNLMQFDHVNIPYSDIYKFNQRVEKLTVKDLQAMVGELYGWKSLTKLVLGNKNLIPKLRKAGYKVKVKKFKDYL